MRKIFEFKDFTKAQALERYLFSIGIEAELRTEEGSYDLWIFSDDDIPKAERILSDFMQNSDDKKFKLTLVHSQASHKKAFSLKKKNPPRKSRSTSSLSVSVILIAICSVIYFVHFFDRSMLIEQYLWFSAAPKSIRNFPEILEGEVWRFFTPCLVHTEFLHIFFNMLWLYQLGNFIESFLSRGSFIALLLLTAAIPNTVFYLIAGPHFQGISGVIYGLIGYLYGVDRFSLTHRSYYDATIYKFFAVFYVICWVLTAFGFGAANTIHGFGAATGLIFAYFYYVPMKNWIPKLNKEVFYNILIGIALLAGGVFTDIWFS